MLGQHEKNYPLPRKGKLYFTKSFTLPVNSVYEKDKV